MDSVPGLLRIGELSRRVGVSDHVLRAWENRYGLLSPVRSAGGFRLYSEHDERRVRRMQAELAKGLSAAQAARVALADELPPKQGCRSCARYRRTQRPWTAPRQRSVPPSTPWTSPAPTDRWTNC